MVSISRELLQRVLSYLERYDDQGDYRGDTWKSKQLEKDISELRAHLTQRALDGGMRPAQFTDSSLEVIDGKAYFRRRK